MALITLGTNATTTLNALNWNPQAAAADIAQIANNIKGPKNPAHPIAPGAFARNGYLHVPGRGILLLQPGDYVAYDSTGWPILVSSNAIANGPWTHS